MKVNDQVVHRIGFKFHISVYALVPKVQHELIIKSLLVILDGQIERRFCFVLKI